MLLCFSRLVEIFFCLGFGNSCLVEGHMETDICVKWWLQKFDLRILKSVTCQGFFNIEESYQGWKCGCFWWNLSNDNPICCTYQTLCMTFTKDFGFLFNFLTSWKSCIKEQWAMRFCFNFFLLNLMICYLRPKRGCNIFESLKSWQMIRSAKDKRRWICIKFCVNK